MPELSDTDPVLTDAAPPLAPHGEGRRLAVVATMWNGAQILAELPPDAAAPAPEQLATMTGRLAAENDGVRPTVRVLEAFAFRRTEQR